MLKIVAVWLVNLTIITAFGVLVHDFLFKKKPKMQIFLLFNGLFAYMLFIWVFLYFHGFGVIFQLIFFVSSLVFLIRRPVFVNNIRQSLKGLSRLNKSIFLLTILVVLMLSAASSSLPDNESYYIQTIKWANEHGFVKGLMNIHPFLGQFSGWHILQTGLNMHYKSFTFNDINGLFFLIFIFYLLQFYRKNRQKSMYWFAVFPVVSVLTVFFIDSPSPDLPVMLLSLIIFDLFVQNFEHLKTNLFVEMFFLTTFSFLIKPTAVINVFLVLILWWRHRRQLKNYSLKLLIFGLFLVSLWISKNYIITGYLLYPFDWLGQIFKSDWQYPPELMQYMAQMGKQESMALSFNTDLITGFWQWLRQPGIHQIINPLMMILLILYPVVLGLKKQKINLSYPYRLLYLLGLLYFIIILFISPNFRFFLAFLLFFSMSIKAFSGQNINFKYFNLSGWSLFLIAGIFLSLHQNFRLNNIIIPQPVSNLNARYLSENIDNFEYHYPDNPQLFWQTGDAPLPAVHKRQIDFFWQHFKMIPQQSQDNKYYYSKTVKIQYNTNFNTTPPNIVSKYSPANRHFFIYRTNPNLRIH